MHQQKINLPCGSVAYFDMNSGCAHRCGTCHAVVGSMGMPKACKTKMNAQQTWEQLGGKPWNFYGEKHDTR